MWWIDAQQNWQLMLLAGGGLLLLLHMGVPRLRRGRAEGVALVLMVAIAIGSAGAYTRFGDFFGKRGVKEMTFHYHDIYHYMLGSKYYPELGHELLYECTWLGFAELRSSGVKCPKVPKLRSLRSPDKFFNPNQRRPRIEELCHTSFGDERWPEFKRDLGVWLKYPWVEQWWRVALADLGFNPPPTYSVFAHNIAEAIPLNKRTIQYLPFVDMSLIFVVGGAMVWWAFGPWAMCAYVVIFGTNWVASYRWTGGSFCRQLWFAWLVYGVCFLKKKHYGAAGAMLALCASMRVFPLVFVLGAMLGLGGAAWRDPRERDGFKRLVASGLGTAVVLFGVSVAQFGIDAWMQFFDKMSHHGTSYFMWHIGFKKWAVFDPAVAEASGVRVARGWWWARPAAFDAIWAKNRVAYEAIRVSMSLAVVSVAWRRPAQEATLIVGGMLLFLWSMPANYYYVWLALLPVVFYRRDGDLWAMLRVALTFGAMFSLSWSSRIHEQPFVMNGWLNWTVLLFFGALLITYGAELAAERWGTPPEPSVPDPA